MNNCAITPSDLSYLSGLIGYFDCQAATIGSSGWLALSAPGSQVSLFSTILLTVLIALIGYRLILGHVPNIREGVLTIARIGVVLTFATSWEAYRTVVYDVALRAPSEIAAGIGGAAQLPGTAGLMGDHLDVVDRQFQTLAIAGVGGPVRFDVAQQYPPPLFAGFHTFALGASRTAFIIGILGSLGSLRLLIGILLALGPLFFGFVLFNSTRGLFGGWIKVLAGAALGSVIVSIIVGVELALLEPWLNQLIERRNAGEAILMAPSQLLALSAVFAFFLLTAVAVGIKLAWGASSTIIRFTKTIRSVTLREPGNSPGSLPSSAAPLPRVDVSRASVLVESVHRLDQRQSMRAVSLSTGIPQGQFASRAYVGTGSPVSSSPSVGTMRRRDTRRTTASATRRDSNR